MKSRSGSRNWLSSWVLLALVAILAACGTISPRRIVTNNPSPSPTPSETPTPSPGITPTPSATPTPTPMATLVPAQFLFVADPGARSVIAFRINSDGGLSPVPGSPFPVGDAPRQMSAAGLRLIVSGDQGTSAFQVNRETGTIARTSSMTMQAMTEAVASREDRGNRVLDASGKFAYALDPARAEISAFAMRDGHPAPLSPALYRAAPGAASLVIVHD